MLQIKFFHQLGSMSTPVTESEKLIWSVLEAERSTIRFLMPQFFTYVFLSFILDYDLIFTLYVCSFLAVSCMRNLFSKQTMLSMTIIKVILVNIISYVVSHTFQVSLGKIYIVSLLFADSLMHRAAFAEILYILDSNRKSEAVKLIEDSVNNTVPR